MLSLTAAVNAFAGPLVEDARAWTPIAPAGATRCLDGSAYTFLPGGKLRTVLAALARSSTT